LGTKINNNRCEQSYPILNCGAQYRRRSESSFEQIIRVRFANRYKAKVLGRIAFEPVPQGRRM